MSFMTAPLFLQKIILIGILLTTVFSACDLYLCARRKGKPYLSAVMQAIVFLLSAFLLVNLAVYVDEKGVEKYPWVSMEVVKLPVWLFVSAETSIILLCAMAILMGYRSDKRHLSRMSVKESFDNLPSGICFYEESGLLRLANVKINELCVKVTGKPLLSGAEFWNTLTSVQPIEPNERIESVETPMIKTDDGKVYSFERIDGKVYSFERIEHETDGKKVYEIVATDITRKYELSEDLSKKNKELAVLNRRMRAYGENIQELTSEKETLNAKIRIHDELGKLLLSTRKSLSEDLTPEAKRELLSAWKTDLLAMGSARSEKVTDTYSGLYSAAKSVGVTLKIAGRKPEEKQLKKVVVTAAIECITNAVKHAKGNAVTVTLTEKGLFLEIVVTNNGEPPKATIKEGGGFSSLRQLVEREGGVMKIQSRPRFMLEITLPKGEIV